MRQSPIIVLLLFCFKARFYCFRFSLFFLLSNLGASEQTEGKSLRSVYVPSDAHTRGFVLRVTVIFNNLHISSLHPCCVVANGTRAWTPPRPPPRRQVAVTCFFRNSSSFAYAALVAGFTAVVIFTGASTVLGADGEEVSLARIVNTVVGSLIYLFVDMALGEGFATCPCCVCGCSGGCARVG